MKLDNEILEKISKNGKYVNNIKVEPIKLKPERNDLSRD